MVAKPIRALEQVPTASQRHSELGDERGGSPGGLTTGARSGRMGAGRAHGK